MKRTTMLNKTVFRNQKEVFYMQTVWFEGENDTKKHIKQLNITGLQKCMFI